MSKLNIMIFSLIFKYISFEEGVLVGFFLFGIKLGEVYSLG